jgi:hypothetical protein
MLMGYICGKGQRTRMSLERKYSCSIEPGAMDVTISGHPDDVAKCAEEIKSLVCKAKRSPPPIEVQDGGRPLPLPSFASPNAVISPYTLPHTPTPREKGLGNYLRDMVEKQDRPTKNVDCFGFVHYLPPSASIPTTSNGPSNPDDPRFLIYHRQ